MTHRSLLASDAVFADMGTRLGPEAVAKVKGVFRFDITEKKKVVKTWTADLKNGDGSLVEGEGTKPDVTITVADADFVKLAAGELDAQKGTDLFNDCHLTPLPSIFLRQTQGQGQHYVVAKVGRHFEEIDDQETDQHARELTTSNHILLQGLLWAR